MRRLTRMTGSAEGSESVAALLRARALRGGLQLVGRPEVPLVKHEALARSHVGGGGQRATSGYPDYAISSGQPPDSAESEQLF